MGLPIALKDEVNRRFELCTMEFLDDNPTRIHVNKTPGGHWGGWSVYGPGIDHNNGEFESFGEAIEFAQSYAFFTIFMKALG